MRLSLSFLTLTLAHLVAASPLEDRGGGSHYTGSQHADHGHHHSGGGGGGDEVVVEPKVVAPKVMIVSMFSPEDVWTTPLGLTNNLDLAGLSPLFPNVNCSPDGQICHMITGEGEINAAVSMTSVVLSDRLDLTQTYFLIAGIAGVNPYMGTLGSVALARYVVQVALAYELDARQMPSNWTTGYWIQGTSGPGETANAQIYGTEVFELNTNLRDAVKPYLSDIALNDSSTAQAWRAQFDYAPANAPPAVFCGDVSTSDVYFAGTLLSEAFGNITKLWTNGTGEYAMTAQEDNASLEAIIRGHKAGLVDATRVIVLRTASDFDRAPPGVDALKAFQADQGAFEPSLQNIFIAGNPIVQGIICDWDSKYAEGVPPQDGFWHNADVLHTLDGGAKVKRSFKRDRRGHRQW